METFLKQSKPFINLLMRLDQSPQRGARDILKGASAPFLRYLSSIARNILKGNFDLNPDVFRFLRQRRTKFRNVAVARRVLDLRSALEASAGTVGKAIARITLDAFKDAHQVMKEKKPESDEEEDYDAVESDEDDDEDQDNSVSHVKSKTEKVEEEEEDEEEEEEEEVSESEELEEKVIPKKRKQTSNVGVRRGKRKLQEEQDDVSDGSERDHGETDGHLRKYEPKGNSGRPRTDGLQSESEQNRTTSEETETGP